MRYVWLDVFGRAEAMLDSIWETVEKAELGDFVRVTPNESVTRLLPVEWGSDIPEIAEKVVLEFLKEDELAHALEQFTNPKSSKYNPAFDSEIRSLAPHWFSPENVERH